MLDFPHGKQRSGRYLGIRAKQQRLSLRVLLVSSLWISVSS